MHVPDPSLPPLSEERVIIARLQRGDRAAAATLLPLDLTCVVAFFLAAAIVRAGALALRGRNFRLAAFLAVPVALFLFHALLTEFLPRFAVPALPLAWGAVTLALCGAHRDPGR